MKPHGLNVEPIVYEGHLVRAVQGMRMKAATARQLAEFAREADQPLPSKGATAAGDPERLRGLPAVVGRGSIGGAIRGTLPHVEALREDRAAAHALAVLVRDDVDGASPGTQPEQALLAAEAERLKGG